MLNATPHSGFADIAIHADATGLWTKISIPGQPEQWQRLRVHTLEKLIRRNGLEGMNIRLLLCNAGAKQYAQELANRLGVTVRSSGDKIHVHTNGRVTTGETELIDTNNWTNFFPER